MIPGDLIDDDVIENKLRELCDLYDVREMIGRRFRHGGHPVLRYCVQCAVPIYGDTGLPYISKRKSTGAIDCLVAAAMAIGRAGEGAGRSIYENEDERPEGLLVL